MALQFGMPEGFAQALALKYGIMQMQAQAQAKSLEAAANLDNTKADLLPKTTHADIAETNARTQGIGLTNQTILPESKARVGLLGSQTALIGSQAKGSDLDNVGKEQIVKKRPFGLGLGGSSDDSYGFGGYGFSF
jgi:hypothetical protein